ncbi:MAG: glycerol-3-phosphate 1-O-acyltransferase PlsY [Gammaproteobacteria bacterium]|nr:glycerol-3-phosphate 1-O-acyltransferase PlsY [Gammaproteobacteria bacterium]
MWLNLSVVLVVYMVGSLPFAIMISKIMGLTDPRQFGSGNPGATNVLRSGNRWAALLTLLGDAGKGWIAVELVTFGVQYSYLADWVSEVAPLVVAAGHIWSVFLKGQGGKGVATFIGVLLGIQVYLGLLVILTWGLVFAVTRISSLSSLCSGAVVSVVVWLVPFDMSSSPWAVIGLFALILYKHYPNLRRLMAGTEPRFKLK